MKREAHNQIWLDEISQEIDRLTAILCGQGGMPKATKKDNSVFPVRKNRARDSKPLDVIQVGKKKRKS